MAGLNVRVEVDADDILPYVTNKDLLHELKSRGVEIEGEPNTLNRSDFADDRAAREYLFNFMGIQPWKGKGELVVAIMELFEL